MSRPALVVVVDGEPMEEASARALWARFSAWMEEHRGDLAGFARQEGFVSVHPGVEGGRPVLRVSNTTPQQAYGGDLPSGGAGGSGERHTAGTKPDRRRSSGPRNRGKKRG
ncbi:MAG: hypothetical protein KF819_04395 [Labilithrix sp.]|nr:hypothetical protein [Labilithrix sp.]